MRREWFISLALVLAVESTTPVVAQSSSTPSGWSQPLVLTGAIPLPSVQGRIDHLGGTPKDSSLFLRWETILKRSSTSQLEE
jgi:hypothetical protein